jgi:hypothetical protein
MQVPKTAMDKNAQAVSRQNDVRSTRHIPPMQAKAIAHGVQKTSDN